MKGSVLRLLQPRTGHPALIRKVTLVRAVFLVLWIVLLIVLWRHRMENGMPNMTAARTGRSGSGFFEWEDGATNFIVKFILGDVFVTALIIGFFRWVVEKIVRARHEANPPQHTKYPY